MKRLFTIIFLIGILGVSFSSEVFADVKNYNYYKSLDPSKYETELKEWFKQKTGKPLNLENPQTLSEKIQWLKLYDSTPIKTRLADKYLVRDWVKEKIGEKYLVPLLGVYNSFDEIDFDKLPNKFVLKANHGSSWNIVVKDKSKFNKENAKRLFGIWLKTNFAFRSGLELHYKNIKPKIIAEKFIDGDMHDYRILCFNGEPKIIWDDKDVVNSAKHSRNIYDTNWNLLPVGLVYPRRDKIDKKPELLDQMLECAKKLCKEFNLVRVDFFITNGKLYFSELTFTPHTGLFKWDPPKYDKIFGDMLTLPNEKYDYRKLF